MAEARLPSRNIMILAAAGLVLAIVVAFLLNRPVRPQASIKLFKHQFLRLLYLNTNILSKSLINRFIKFISHQLSSQCWMISGNIDFYKLIVFRYECLSAAVVFV